MDAETKEKLEDFLDEARRRLSVPTGLTNTQVKTHIARFQDEILKFLDHSFYYLEGTNPNVDHNTLYFPRGIPNEKLKSYLQRQNKKYLSTTKQVLVGFHDDIRRNGYAISRIDAKAKHGELHNVGTEPVVSFSITNMSAISDDQFIKRSSDGSTNIGGFIRLAPGAKANITNSVFTGPDGAVIVNNFSQEQKSNKVIMFKDGTSLPFQEWAASCIATCESIYNRIK